MRETPALDGMRGAAALLVVGFHVAIFTVDFLPGGADLSALTSTASTHFFGWGFIGVDFFFVLSAFLLAQPFLAGGLARGLKGYWVKRFLRIAPAYYASLLVAWVLVGRTGHPWFAMDWTQVWRHLTFTHGFWWDSQLAVSAVYWSLAVELQFYLLLPFLVLPFRTRWWPIALAAALAVTLAYRWWLPITGDPVMTRFYDLQLPGFLWHFALGIVAARLRNDVRALPWHPARFDAAIVMSTLIFVVAPSAVFGFEATLFGQTTRDLLLAYRPLVAVGCAGAILFGCAGKGAVNQLFSSRPFLALGAWSYSLYLTHYAVIALILLLVPDLLGLTLPALVFALAVASILVAAVFFRVVEAPALRLKDAAAGWASRRGRPEP